MRNDNPQPAWGETGDDIVRRYGETGENQVARWRPRGTRQVHRNWKVGGSRGPEDELTARLRWRRERLDVRSTVTAR